MFRKARCDGTDLGRQRELDIREFEASLVSIVHFRTARAPQRETVSQNQKLVKVKAVAIGPFTGFPDKPWFYPKYEGVLTLGTQEGALFEEIGLSINIS